MATNIVRTSRVELVMSSEAPSLLRKVRPSWQSKSLIDRVRALLQVDPSSACQRLFNAAIHDLREKISIAGLDIAGEAAKQNGLPTVAKTEDVENYPPAKLIDLAYRMGLLSRPEWRRVHRCYEIRRDLEHEDDEYEAGVEDCIYIFSTCVEVILSRDPIHLIRVTDIKALIEQASAVAPSKDLLEDYERAPLPRQEEICKFLVSIALDKKQSDIVQQNAYAFLQALEHLTRNPAKISLAENLQEKIGRNKIDTRVARVAIAIGVFSYLRKNQREQLFSDLYQEMKKIGHHWSAYNQHGELLRGLMELGGLKFCPESVIPDMLKWLLLTYIGEPGGQTRYGNVRHVFYSNSGAPLAAEIISSRGESVISELKKISSNRQIAALLENQHVLRRYDRLLDSIETEDASG